MIIGHDRIDDLAKCGTADDHAHRQVNHIALDGKLLNSLACPCSFPPNGDVEKTGISPDSLLCQVQTGRWNKTLPLRYNQRLTP